MTPTQWRLLDALCRVRGLTAGQALRLLGAGDRANLRRLLRPLAAGLVAWVRVPAKPVPAMCGPLYDSAAPDAPPVGAALGGVLYRARKRWALAAAAPTRVLVATARAGRLFGVRRTGGLARPQQVSHDLAVSAAWLALREADPAAAAGWRGEDGGDVPALGGRIPDAVLVDARGRPRAVVEVVGAEYTRAKLAALARGCAERGLAYAFW